jgi:hypothetical protein
VVVVVVVAGELIPCNSVLPLPPKKTLAVVL